MIKKYYGIDISEHQGVINYSEFIKNKSHTDFIIIRMGYGDNLKSQDDKCFINNYENCVKYKIPVGGYLYSYANDMRHATSEIAHIKRLLKNKSFDLPIFIDIEDKIIFKNDEKQITKIYKYMITELKKSGINVGIYSNLNILEKYFTDDFFTKIPIWIAQYHNVCEYEKPYLIWQYSDKGYLKGVNTCADLNVMFKSNSVDSKTLIDNILNDYKKIIQDVLKGVYGNGDKRKKLLISKGYNYDFIQEIINKILN